MNFATSVENDAPVVYIRGELDVVTVEEMRESLDRLAAAGHRNVIIDLSGLRVIDSSGVGSIIALYKRVRSYGGIVSVRGARDQPLAILRLLNLDRLLIHGESAAT
jgi:anti-sigma B factor antagonist